MSRPWMRGSARRGKGRGVIAGGGGCWGCDACGCGCGCCCCCGDGRWVPLPAGWAAGSTGLSASMVVRAAGDVGDEVCGGRCPGWLGEAMDGGRRGKVEGGRGGVGPAGINSQSASMPAGRGQRSSFSRPSWPGACLVDVVSRIADSPILGFWGGGRDSEIVAG